MDEICESVDAQGAVELDDGCIGDTAFEEGSQILMRIFGDICGV